ncbi:MAG: nicotinate (nicotinamide) nucleotide adenylyltransferase [Chloroflexi bacterium]|nr:nicotinate (nicotinamide) nucleotide adenylyltransferase [Chloroflexota bacterium]
MIYNVNPPKTDTTQIKIGVLGGTFDPPHWGHLKIAAAAIEKLGLSEVMFAPAGEPPHKLGQTISPIEHRVEMVRLAISQDPRWVLSYADIGREGPSYTVELLRTLRRGLSDAIELYFMMGMDSLAAILTWREPAEIIRMARLAVFGRPGFSADVDKLESQLPGLRSRIEFVDAERIEISASEIQRRVRAGESIAEMTPPIVAEYIEANRLYK